VGLASRVLRTNFVILDYCSHTWNGRGRGSREETAWLYYYLIL